MASDEAVKAAIQHYGEHPHPSERRLAELLDRFAARARLDEHLHCCQHCENKFPCTRRAELERLAGGRT